MDRRKCKCGHSAYDHLGAGRCNDARKRCGCQQFVECLHPTTRPWHITRPAPRTEQVCATCNLVMDSLPEPEDRYTQDRRAAGVIQ